MTTDREPQTTGGGAWTPEAARRLASAGDEWHELVRPGEESQFPDDIAAALCEIERLANALAGLDPQAVEQALRDQRDLWRNRAVSRKEHARNMHERLWDHKPLSDESCQDCRWLSLFEEHDLEDGSDAALTPAPQAAPEAEP